MKAQTGNLCRSLADLLYFKNIVTNECYQQYLNMTLLGDLKTVFNSGNDQFEVSTLYYIPDMSKRAQQPGVGGSHK